MYVFAIILVALFTCFKIRYVCNSLKPEKTDYKTTSYFHLIQSAIKSLHKEHFISLKIEDIKAMKKC